MAKEVFVDNDDEDETICNLERTEAGLAYGGTV
jgi:hypothetical protein